eukprot:687967-Amphidinium_carterae.1
MEKNGTPQRGADLTTTQRRIHPPLVQCANDAATTQNTVGSWYRPSAHNTMHYHLNSEVQ